MLKKIYHFFHLHYHRRYHGIYRHAKQLFVFDLILLTTAFFLLASSLFFFFWKPSLVDQIDISFSFNTTSTIRSGEETHLVISYTNNSKEKLNSPTLAIRLPRGFVLDKTRNPKNFSEQSTLALQSIEPGGTGQIDLYGHIWSEPNREDKLITILSYIPENKKQTEQKVNSFFITLPESVLISQLTLPTSSFPAQSLPFIYTLTNTGKEPVSNITIVGPTNLPISYSTNSTSSAFGELFSMAPGETKKITGLLTAPDQPGKYPLEFSSAISTNNGVRITQTHTSMGLQIIYPQLDSEIHLKNEISFAEPGTALPLQISWKNNSPLRINSLKLKINFSPAGIVDLQKTAQETGFKIENSGLIIDNSKRTALSNAVSGSKDTFDLPLFLLPHFNLDPAEKVSLVISPHMEGQAAEIGGQTFNQPGKDLTVPLSTEVSMDSEVRYFTIDGEQLGRGPLPPHVGETTKYWIFVDLHNTSNPLRTPQFKAILSPGVEFTGKQSVSLGDPLQTENGSVVWSASEIPPNSQTSLYFEVAVTPTADQKGKELSLIDKILFNAHDGFVPKDFHIELPRINNKLQPDDKGFSKGVKTL